MPTYPQLQRWHPQAQGLVFALPAHEGAGTTATAFSNDGVRDTLDCTLVNGVSWHAGERGALGFVAASSQYVLVGEIPSFPQGSDPRAISVWVNVAATAFSGGAVDVLKISDEGTNGRSFELFAEGGGFSVGFNGHRIITPTGFSANTWYHVAIVIPSGSSLTSDVIVYVNGYQQAMSTQAGSPRTLNTLNGAIELGADSGDGNFFTGSIADVRFYNRALDLPEIQDIYADLMAIWTPRKKVFAVTSTYRYRARPQQILGGGLI